MNSWFTPTVLFVFLNLMIGTIAFTSGLGSTTQTQQRKQLGEEDTKTELGRSPSILQRLKSINLSSYRSQEPAPLTSSIATTASNPLIIENEHTLPFPDNDEQAVEEGEQTLDEIYDQIQGRHFDRTRSDPEPSSDDLPATLLKMKKSASLKSSVVAHFKEDDVVESRRPATVREGKAKVVELKRLADGDDDGDGNSDDEQVDAKADDFINKFKQQLKLQRLDSMMRYREVIKRGNGGAK